LLLLEALCLPPLGAPVLEPYLRMAVIQGESYNNNGDRIHSFGLFTAVRPMMVLFWVLAPCRLLVDANVSKEHTASTFRVEEIVCFSETLASTGEAIRCQNPEQRHQGLFTFNQNSATYRPTFP
jgi:hypothetical protein